MPGPSRRHEATIDLSLQHAHRKGFARALRVLLGIAMDPQQRFVPDAYRTQRVTVYEVEVTHALTERKFLRLRSLRDQLVTIGWSLRLMHLAAGDRAGAEVDIDTGQPDEADLQRAARLLDRGAPPS